MVLLIDAQKARCRRPIVTKKALALGLKPIVVANKVDKPGAKPEMVVNAAFELFDKLGANDEQLDFPVVYASGINGWSSLVEGERGEKWARIMSALFDTVLKHVEPNKGDLAAPLQLQISALDFRLVGRIGVGRILARSGRRWTSSMEGSDGKAVKGRINQVLTFQGPPRAGDRSRPGRDRAGQRHRRRQHRRHDQTRQPPRAADDQCDELTRR